MKALKTAYQYLYNLAVAVDQFVNVLFGGDPDETISSRVGKAEAAGSTAGKIAALAINALFYLPDGLRWHHCRRSIDPFEGAKAVWRVKA